MARRSRARRAFKAGRKAGARRVRRQMSRIIPMRQRLGNRM